MVWKKHTVKALCFNRNGMDALWWRYTFFLYKQPVYKQPVLRPLKNEATFPSVQEVVGRTSIGRQFPTSVDGRRRVRNESSVDGRKTTSSRRRKQTSIWRPELTSRWRRISTVDRRLICDVIMTVARRPFSTSILRPSSTSNWRPHMTGYSRSLLTWFFTGRFNLLLYFPIKQDRMAEWCDKRYMMTSQVCTL